MKSKLKKVLEDRGITQKQLAEMTGLRPNAISELVNNSRQTVNREQVKKIMEALNINSYDDIFE